MSNKTANRKSIAIIGGGAAGLSAAYFASKNGNKVTIFEHKDKVGKKILTTGNGKCNFTNACIDSNAYFSNNRKLLEKILEKMPTENVLKLFDELGILYKEKNGLYYPYSEQAKTVTQAFFDKLEQMHVFYRFENVDIIKKIQNDRYLVNDEVFDAVIMATGGRSHIELGSDGSGYMILEALGIKKTAILPGLTQFKCKEKFYKTLSGQRIAANISLMSGNEQIAAERGELLFNDKGVSGIAVMCLSNWYNEYMEKNNHKASCYLDINMMEDVSENDIFDFLKKKIKSNSEASIECILNGLLPSKINYVLLQVCEIQPEKAAGKVSDNELKYLIHNIHHFRCHITDTADFDNSQVTFGGIDLNEINIDTFESQKNKNLYICGELLDVCGKCGGYNLHFAFESGRIAGENI